MAALKAAGQSPGGRAVVYRPIRTFFRWCVARELLQVSPAEKVAPPIVKAQPLVFVTDDEFDRILKTTVTRSRWAFRARCDRAILLMLTTTGARLSEVAEVRVHDLELDSGTFTVHGRGGKDRALPMLPDAREALTTYLRLERPRNPVHRPEKLRPAGCQRHRVHHGQRHGGCPAQANFGVQPEGQDTAAKSAEARR
jgi:site-specific recombinase XerD